MAQKMRARPMASRSSCLPVIARSGARGSRYEVQREVVRREDLAERDRRLQRRDGGDEPVVDAEPAQLPVRVAAERVVAGCGDDGGAQTVPGRGDRDIGRAPAEVLAEGLDVFEADAVLQRVEVHADAADADEIVRLVRVRHDGQLLRRRDATATTVYANVLSNLQELGCVLARGFRIGSKHDTRLLPAHRPRHRRLPRHRPRDRSGTGQDAPHPRRRTRPRGGRSGGRRAALGGLLGRALEDAETEGRHGDMVVEGEFCWHVPTVCRGGREEEGRTFRVRAGPPSPAPPRVPSTP